MAISWNINDVPYDSDQGVGCIIIIAIAACLVVLRYKYLKR
jgi:hypothetical protein